MNNLTPKINCHGKLNLIPDYIAVIPNIRCCLHTIGNHCAKYEHCGSNMKKRLVLRDVNRF